MKCINLAIPQFKKLANEIGEVKLAKLLDKHFPETDIPSESELYSKIKPNEVNFNLKVIDSLYKIKNIRQTIRLNSKDKPYIEKNLRKQLAGTVPSNQIDFIFDIIRQSGNKEMSTDDIINSLLADNSFVVEVNTAKKKQNTYEALKLVGKSFEYNGDTYNRTRKENSLTDYYTKNGKPITSSEYTEASSKKQDEFEKKVPTQYYSTSTVPGGTNYTENEIATPDIIPSIKGHGEFSTYNGIGWFRSDDKTNIVNDENADLKAEMQGGRAEDYITYEPTKTRRILEVQSDLFQKGRNRKTLAGKLTNSEIKGEYLMPDVSQKTQNKFLQLLNKDNNWVTFFVKSIIQDSAKKGYEKVLFPSGETAAKIQRHEPLGHEAIAEEIRKIDKQIENAKYDYTKKSFYEFQEKNKQVEESKKLDSRLMGWIDVKNEYNHLSIEDSKKEVSRLEQQKQNLRTQGLEKLKPIEGFYEIRVTNILNKTYGKDNVKTITDEYGNKWNEIKIDSQKNLSPIFLQLPTEAELRQYIKSPSEARLYDNLGKDQVYKTMKKLSQKFNLPFKFDESMSVKGMVRKDGVIVINPKLATHDTLFHEFAHPLVNLLKAKNPTLFRALLKEAKNSDKATLRAIDELYSDYSVEHKELELLTSIIGKRASERDSQHKKNLLQKFWNWLSEVFDGLFGTEGGFQLNENTTIEDLVDLMVNNKAIDLSNYTSEEFQRDAASHIAELMNDESVNEIQKSALNELSPIIEADLFINETTNEYNSSIYPDFKGQRASEHINKAPAYRFEGESELFNLSRDWGNIVDDVASSALTGESFDSALENINNLEVKGNLSREALESLYNQLKEFKSQRPKSIFLTQVKPFNLSKQFGGAIDLIEIAEDGERTLWDVKSSQYTTSPEGYTTLSDIKRNYNKPFKQGKASTKAKHEAQVSFYKGLAFSKGFRIDNLGILPVHITKLEGNEVKEVVVEPTFNTKEGTLTESELHFLEAVKDDKFEGDQISPEVNSQSRLLHDKVLKLIEAEKKILEQEGGTYSKSRIRKLENLQDNIKTVKSIIALENFTNAIYEMFVEYTTEEGKKVNSNFEKDKDKVIYNYKKGNYNSDIEALNDMYALMEHIEMYEETISGMENFYYENTLGADMKEEAGSNLEKIRKTTNKFREHKADLNSQIKPLYAEIIGKFENKAVGESIRPYIERYENKRATEIEELQNSMNSKMLKAASEKEKNDIRALEYDETIKIQRKYDALISKLADQVGSPENILKIMDNGYLGINMGDAYFTPVSHLPNPVVAQFQKAVKRAFEKIKDEMQVWGMNAVSVMEKTSMDKTGLITSGNSVNESMIEERNGKLFLVSEIDWSGFYSLREKDFSSIEKNQELKSDMWAAKRQWYLSNTEEVPFKDVTINHPFNKTKILIQKGKETILNEKKQELLKEYGSFDNPSFIASWESWLESNTMEGPNGTIYTGREFRVPKKSKFTNPRYKAVLNNPKTKEYYEFLVSALAEAYSNYPQERSLERMYQLPSIPKEDTDRLLENGMKDYFTNIKNRNFGKQLAEDEEIYGISSMIPGAKNVPKMYQSNNIEVKDISRDLMTSIMRFLQASKQYNSRRSLSSLSKITLKSLKNAKELEPNAKAVKTLFAKAEELGIQMDKYKKRHGNNYTAMALEAFIDAEIYGITSKKQEISLLGAKRDVGKMTDFLSYATSMTTIAAKPLVALANVLQQNVMMQIEAFAQEHVSAKSFTKAQGIYAAKLLDYVKDIVQGHNSSFMGQLIDLYDPIMGNFRDQFGREISNGVGKRLMNTSSLYAMMKAGDHQTYVSMMIAMMLDTKVKNKDGNEINLYNAYELNKETGVLQLKKGVELPNEGRIHYEMKEKMDMVNQRLHGVYNSFDKPLAERFAQGRLVSMFRKFVAPGIKRRYKGIGVDHNTGTVSEGFYSAFMRLAFTEFSELKNFVFMQENNLAPEEKANVKRFLYEAGMMLLLGAIVMSLSALYEGTDDPDDKRMLGLPLYLAYRLRSELLFYNPASPGDMLRILRSPTVTFSMIERITKFGSQLYDPFGEYKATYGIWEKGDSKLKARTLQLFGITGKTLHPDLAYNQLKNWDSL